MAQENPKDNIFTVKCAHCHKPFHYKPKPESKQSKSDKPGEVEIILECPYCQTQLTVAVPPEAAEDETMYRGAGRELTSRKVSQ